MFAVVIHKPFPLPALQYDELISNESQNDFCFSISRYETAYRLLYKLYPLMPSISEHLDGNY